MESTVINLLGSFRVGTNFTRTLLEQNYDVSVKYDSLGWKHGLLPTYTRDSRFSYDDPRPLVVVKNPYATLDSWYGYVTSNGNNFDVDASSLDAFVSSRVVFRNSRDQRSPEYLFQSPVEMWNSVTWNHVRFAEANGGLVVRYEDLLASPAEVCARIAEHYGLRRITKEFVEPQNVTRNMGDSSVQDGRSRGYTTGRTFDKTSYFLDVAYMENFKGKTRSSVASRIDENLSAHLGYSRRGGVVSDVDDSRNDYVIYTVVSVSRLKDFRRLAISNQKHDAALIRVIPFDDVLDTSVEDICREYGAEIVEPSKEWDELGRALFGDEQYRPGVPSWRYFRKLNALDCADGPFIFLDANTAITSSLRPVVASLDQNDIVFGTRAKKNRNFRPWASNLLAMAGADVNDGFNAGFWAADAGAVDAEAMKQLGKFPGTRSFVTMSPEQSVLSLTVSLSGMKAAVISEAVDGYSNMVSAVSADETKIHFDGDALIDGRSRKIPAVKWTGHPHLQGDSMPLLNLSQTILNG